LALYRLSEPAKADIAYILRVSEKMHGGDARVRYRGLLTAALRRIAADPEGFSTVDRGELAPSPRSFHVRHCRAGSREEPVADPRLVIFYRGGGAAVDASLGCPRQRGEMLLREGRQFPPRWLSYGPPLASPGDLGNAT